jgi:RHS repeat-associated protein
MNILFFDENFNFVPYDNITGLGSYAWRVGEGGDGRSIPAQISKAPKNGYAFVYLSNESKTYVYFDNFEVTHVRGRLIEENAYYPYGLKIAALSSKVFDASPNPYQYQGEYNDFEDETAWNDFELRTYDGQIGKFLQNDPYDQFGSPYTGMGNDPINNIDPSGGWIFSSIGIIEHGLWAVGGAVAGTLIAGASNGWNANAMKQGAAIGGGIGLGASFVNWGAIGGALGNAGNWVGQLLFTDDWKGFYKSDLIKYVADKGIDPNENNLGDEFEKIFEKHMLETFPLQTKTFRFRRSIKKMTDGGERNSKPDFVADDFYDEAPFFAPKKIKWVVEGSAYEVKQNGGKGIYPSSNTGQIKAHITNLAIRHASDISTQLYNPSVTLITTYDVNLSPGIAHFASKNKVLYTHRRSRFKIVNGTYKFKFVGFGVSAL